MSIFKKGNRIICEKMKTFSLNTCSLRKGKHEKLLNNWWFKRNWNYLNSIN